MTIEECYARMEADYAGVLLRLGKEDRVRRFLLKFPGEPSMENLRRAFAEGNMEEAFRAAHSLKGVCANLGLSALLGSSAALTEELRGGASSDGIQALLARVESDYRLTVDSIRELDADV